MNVISTSSLAAALLATIGVAQTCGTPASAETFGTGNAHAFNGLATINTLRLPTLGGQGRYEVEYANNGAEPAITLVGFAGLSTPPAILPFPLFIDLGFPVATLPFTLDGQTTRTLSIDATPSLCTGLPVFLQVMVLDTEGGTDPSLPIVASNRLDWVIGDQPELVITEVMQNPAMVLDSAGEWFEAYNTTGAPLDITGWRIRDNDSDTHTIASVSGPVIVPAGAHFVFGLNADPLLNGDVAVDYVYTGLFLGNNTDSIVIERGDGSIVDSVVWDDGATFPDPSGASMSLDPGAYDAAGNDLGFNWCIATTQIGAGTDFGTPGSLNSLCND